RWQSIYRDGGRCSPYCSSASVAGLFAKLTCHRIGNGNRYRRSAMRHAATDARHLAGGHGPALVRKRKRVRHALGAHAGNRHVDIEHFLAACRRLKFTRSSHARKRYHLAPFFSEHAEAKVPQESVLSPFHETEEGRKVHDPGHVGIGK